MATTSLLARLRNELLTKISAPTNAKPSSLRNWLRDSQLLISRILTDLKAEAEFCLNTTSEVISIQDGLLDETFIVLQINLTIRQLFPDTFISALIAHARHSFRSWLRSPTTGRLITVVKEFELCKKFGWTDLYRQNYTDMLHQAIEQMVDQRCIGQYQTEFLPELRSFVDERILPFAMKILSSDKKVDLPSDNEKNFKLKVLFHNSLLLAISKSRAKEFFEIVADFPDSIIAIKELKEAANKTSNMPYIGKAFKTSICKRLLHSGASTSQILEMYVSMIRALRVLDPSDLVLNFIAAPVRTYLMERKDTVRSIVSSLTKNKDSDLHDELKKGGSLVYGVDEDDEENGPGDAWEPRMRDRDLTEPGVRGLDVLALLVSIYGSTDLFVTEYRTLLADKLLSNLLYDTDLELATLELLKMRFGEESLRCCEVMLRDIEESKRVNNAILFELKKEETTTNSKFCDNIIMDPQNVDCVMVSDNYWPALLKEPFTHHPAALQAIGAYQQVYTMLKKPRKLHLCSQLGVAELELEFQDGSSRTFMATVMQSSLIMHLSDCTTLGGMTARELSEKCEVEEQAVLSQMTFWSSRGVVRTRRNDVCDTFYEIIEVQADRAKRDLEEILPGASNDVTEQDFEISAGVSSDATQRTSLVTFGKFIKGMLSSHESMHIERLHSMLRLISSNSEGNEAKFDMNLVQLRQFLQTLIDANKIEFIDNTYRIRKH